MNIISLILFIIIAFSVLNGFARGFILSFANLLSWVVTVVLMFLFYPLIADLLKSFTDSYWVIPLAILISILITSSLISYLIDRLLVLIPVPAHENIINKILGVVPGVVIGLLYASLLTLFLLLIPLNQGITNEVRESDLAQKLSLNLENMEKNLKPGIKEAVNRSLQITTIEEGSKEKLILPFSVKNPSVQPELEAEMLTMINAERERHGLHALTADTALRAVARAHSRDMFAQSYFSHIGLDGSTPFDRISRADIFFLTAGENLALAQTLPIAHEGLMNSPGHRANILNPAYGKVGIGILDGGVYGLMVTQNFKN